MISDLLDLTPTELDQLKKQNVGDLTGLTSQQAIERYPRLHQIWRSSSNEAPIPNAEPFSTFRSRMVAAFDRISTQHRDSCVAVVCHGGVLKTYLNHLVGLATHYSPFHFANGSVGGVETSPDQPRVLWLNSTCHLRRSL